MNKIEDELLKLLKDACQKAFDLEVSDSSLMVEIPKDSSNGDYATNIAMRLAKELKRKPLDIAKDLEKYLVGENVLKVEIAGPGFINFWLKKDAMADVLNVILTKKEKYGSSEIKKDEKILLEYVSANPTGILHLGHARGAAYGDSVARILRFAGYDALREYYINDAGNQMNMLSLSIEARYREAYGLDFELPEDGYHGQDVKNIAMKIREEYGDHLLEREDHLQFFMETTMKYELDQIKVDLATFRVKHDVYSSEKVIRGNDAIKKELEFLKDHTYVADGATYLKTTDYLDDKDRVIVKTDGDYTYFMPDIVYHVNKMSRGFDQLIDVLGADHHGYINRMKSALMMHGYKPEVLEIELIQMVRFIKDGQEFKASKRKGDAITLKDICEEVGVDAMRYFFAMRATSGHLDFDMNLAKEQSSNNPVYYAQYAHARLCSILEQGKDIPLDLSGTKLGAVSEMELLKHLSNFPNLVSDAAKERAPYKITNYIHDLAEKIHAFYGECRVIDRNDLETTASRLALVKACEQVIKTALSLIGVSAPEHM